MISSNIFYHQITRKLIVAFGSLFSDVKIARMKDGNVIQTLQIPISYAPKEKWIVRIEQDPNLDSHTYTTLPRMSFEITGMNYDSARKSNRMSYITCGTETDTIGKVYSPVPYNFDISLYILTKTQEDALQVVEQILPFFTPEYTLSLKPIDGTDFIMDVPIIVNSVSVQDDYDGDFSQRRFVTYTLTFTLKANMYGPVTDGKVINHTFVDVNNTNIDPLTEFFLHESEGESSTATVIVDTVTENLY
jgi:hypothetical protein